MSNKMKDYICIISPLPNNLRSLARTHRVRATSPKLAKKACQLETGAGLDGKTKVSAVRRVR